MDFEGKLLGLLNNVSEVPSLRSKICDEPEFLSELVWRLKRFSDTERHYFAGGIIANVLNEPGHESLQSLADELSQCVEQWKIPRRSLRWVRPTCRFLQHKRLRSRLRPTAACVLSGWSLMTERLYAARRRMSSARRKRRLQRLRRVPLGLWAILCRRLRQT